MKLSSIISKEYSSLEEREKYFIKRGSNAIVERLDKELNLWKSITSNPDFYNPYTRCAEYFYEGIRKIPYGRDEITECSVLFQKYQEHSRFNRVGSFLTKLIELHHETEKKKEEYLIITGDMKKPYTQIGIGSPANIRILGDVGEKVGWGSTGKITVCGNADYQAGYRMESGTLIIEGNTGYGLGEQMVGGVIYVKKNAGNHIGSQREGGEIHIDGTYGDLSSIFEGGKVFHQGRCICSK